jgi:hypothetical protein
MAYNISIFNWRVLTVVWWFASTQILKHTSIKVNAVWDIWMKALLKCLLQIGAYIVILLQYKNIKKTLWSTLKWLPAGAGNFLFTTVSRIALEPTQPPIQWLPGALSLRVKRPGCEADHSPPSRAEVKGWVELYLHALIRLCSVVLS